MRNFYKSCKGAIPSIYDDIVKEFINGREFLPDIPMTCNLPKGISKYNKSLLMETKDISLKFKHLLAIEVSIFNIIQLCMPEDKPFLVTKDLGNMIIAHKGTIKILDGVGYALKTYLINGRNKIYEAIKNNNKKCMERYTRNVIALDVLIIDCGLSILVNAVKEKYNETIYEFISKLNEEFFSKFTIKDFESEEEYYKKQNDYYLSAILSIVDKETLQNSVMDNYNKRNEKYKESRELIKKRRKWFDNQRIIRRYDEAIQLHADYVYKVIYSNNENKKMGADNYNKLMRYLVDSGGHGSYISIMIKSRLQFLSEKGNLISAFGHIRLYPNEHCNEILKDMSDLRSRYPDAVIIPRTIIIPV